MEAESDLQAFVRGAIIIVVAALLATLLRRFSLSGPRASSNSARYGAESLRIAKQKLLPTAELRSAFLAEVSTLNSGSDRRAVLEALQVGG